MNLIDKIVVLNPPCKGSINSNVWAIKLLVKLNRYSTQKQTSQSQLSNILEWWYIHQIVDAQTDWQYLLGFHPSQQDTERQNQRRKSFVKTTKIFHHQIQGEDFRKSAITCCVNASWKVQRRSRMHQIKWQSISTTLQAFSMCFLLCSFQFDTENWELTQAPIRSTACHRVLRILYTSQVGWLTGVK